MRAKEFINEEINPDIRHSEFKHELEIDGLRYTAETDNNSGYGNQLIIKVYDGNKEVANAEFYEEPHDNALISMNTWVISNYQGQNIATNMYAYAKMLGNDIIPSDTQTDQGERMWRSWNQSGQSKHILPKGQKGYRDLVIHKLTKVKECGALGTNQVNLNISYQKVKKGTESTKRLNQLRKKFDFLA